MTKMQAFESELHPVCRLLSVIYTQFENTECKLFLAECDIFLAGCDIFLAGCDLHLVHICH